MATARPDAVASASTVEPVTCSPWGPSVSLADAAFPALASLSPCPLDAFSLAHWDASSECVLVPDHCPFPGCLTPPVLLPHDITCVTTPP